MSPTDGPDGGPQLERDQSLLPTSVPVWALLLLVTVVFLLLLMCLVKYCYRRDSSNAKLERPSASGSGPDKDDLERGGVNGVQTTNPLTGLQSRSRGGKEPSANHALKVQMTEFAQQIPGEPAVAE